MRKLIVSLLALATLCSPLAKADEGMWLVNMMEQGLIRNMKAAGLKLDPGVIYDADKASISDAIVAIDFFGTGSIVSPQGLVITNHHVAYDDVHSFSTPEQNYLEKGFWARSLSEEKPVKGRSAYILRKVLDVTDEAKALCSKENIGNKPMGSRKLSYMLEKKYSEEYSLEASLGIMWRGCKYYMFLYDKYEDVRLVAAPPVTIAAFGGDTDNWEWPQHKGDFAFYRIYTSPDGSPAKYSENNVPLVPKYSLKVSTKGVGMGDYTMILGFPGSTDRYCSSYRENYIENVRDRGADPFMKRYLEIMNDWSEKDDRVRLQYADTYFTASNVQENREGEMMALRRYGIGRKLKNEEAELQSWLESKADGRETLLDELKKLYESNEEAEKQLVYFREGFIRGGHIFPMASSTLSTFHSSKKDKVDLSANPVYMGRLRSFYDSHDMRVERDMFIEGQKMYLRKAAPSTRGSYYDSLLACWNGDVTKMAESIWDSSVLGSKERMTAFVSRPICEKDLLSDPLLALFASKNMRDYNEKTSSTSDLDRKYTKALYEMRLEKKVPQYPDANSTLRLTYGNVCDMYPRDGVHYCERSTTDGILEKYDPEDYEFRLDSLHRSLLTSHDWGKWSGRDGKMQVNFLTSNDITGGNSGSPVLDARGEVVGLAFDGNKESLCSDIRFEPRYCKTVCVDIRYVLWVLDKYAGMQHLLDEMNL